MLQHKSISKSTEHRRISKCIMSLYWLIIKQNRNKWKKSVAHLKQLFLSSKNENIERSKEFYQKMYDDEVLKIKRIFQEKYDELSNKYNQLTNDKVFLKLKYC